VGGEGADAAAEGEPGGQPDADGLAEDEAGGDAEADAAGEAGGDAVSRLAPRLAVGAAAGEGDAGVGEGEDGDDEEGDAGDEAVLEALQGGLGVLAEGLDDGEVGLLLDVGHDALVVVAGILEVVEAAAGRVEELLAVDAGAGGDGHGDQDA